MRLRLTSGAVAVMGIVVSIPCLWAQDLGDVVRQDRERRSRLSRHAPVLTNEDLARERILTPEWREVLSPATVGMVQQVRSSAADPMRPDIEIVAPTLPSRTQEYTEPVFAVTATNGEPVSLGEYARQPRAYRAAHGSAQTPDAATAERAVADPQNAGISLGEYARRLRVLRSMATSESASIAPLPPRTEAKTVQPEISLGEYARRLRIRRAAEEYARLLAQDDTSVAAALAGDAIPPVRNREIRPSAPSLRQRRAAVAVAARNNPGPAPEGHIAVTVRRGDSLWRLARTYLGSGARWQSISFLYRHPGSPHVIRADEVVLIAVSDSPRARAFAVASRRPGSPLR